jgi:hypothetical protein
LVGVSFVVYAVVDACFGRLAETVPFLPVRVERRGEGGEIFFWKKVKDAEDPELGLIFSERWDCACNTNKDLMLGFHRTELIEERGR